MKYFGIRRECQFEVARCSCPRLRVDVVPNVSQHSGIFRESTVVNKTDKTREQGSAKISALGARPGGATDKATEWAAGSHQSGLSAIIHPIPRFTQSMLRRRADVKLRKGSDLETWL